MDMRGLSFLEDLFGGGPRCPAGVFQSNRIVFFGVITPVNGPADVEDFRVHIACRGRCFITEDDQGWCIAIGMSSDHQLDFARGLVESAHLSWAARFRAQLRTEPQSPIRQVTQLSPNFLQIRIAMQEQDHLFLKRIWNSNRTNGLMYMTWAVKKRLELLFLRRCLLDWLNIARSAKIIRSAVLEWSVRPEGCVTALARTRFMTS